ncbi:MAG: glycosyltransferase [Muribaculaceae bacterium]|nr:glycosyltransferase [Muribaculaceae bacterium]
MKTPEKKRILLMADYSNFHATLALGLRKLGCEVTVASDGGSFMKCNRDVDLSRRFSGKLGGLLYAVDVYRNTLTKLKGFDIVSFRDPAFLDLKPNNIAWLFNVIASKNTRCYLSYLSTDIPFLDMLEAPDSPLRYNEWFISGEPNRNRIQNSALWDSWHSPQMAALNRAFYARIDGAVTALYEYHQSALRIFPKERVAYGGLPVDVDSIDHKVISNPQKVRIFLARDYRRKLEKGSDLLEVAARNVVSRHPHKAELVMVENVSRSEYLKLMQSCHLMLDQMYSYTPATMALEGMASGLSVISGGEEDFYNFIGENELRPIINSPVDLETLERTVEEAVLNPALFEGRSRMGRAFVEKHHRPEVVAARFLDFWNRREEFHRQKKTPEA